MNNQIVVKQNDTYTVTDMSITNLVLSHTYLHPGKNTTGHSHIETDEVYLISSGKGYIKINNDKYNIRKGDIIPIKAGDFHQVFNTEDCVLHFISIFAKYGDRK